MLFVLVRFLDGKSPAPHTSLPNPRTPQFSASLNFQEAESPLSAVERLMGAWEGKRMEGFPSETSECCDATTLYLPLDYSNDFKGTHHQTLLKNCTTHKAPKFFSSLLEIIASHRWLCAGPGPWRTLQAFVQVGRARGGAAAELPRGVIRKIRRGSGGLGETSIHWDPDVRDAEKPREKIHERLQKSF